MAGDIAFRMARYLEDCNRRVILGLEGTPEEPSSILVSDINQVIHSQKKIQQPYHLKYFPLYNY